ncbi:hypothetical protein KGF54_003402 [Candida jiufengensis]|uniref:uncharacterized protein n=1 Tax=Candida jiufengensis TaxID=497108 RepID=UPI0022251DBA|nr:uncharacterized protein KGF54_003402 [Candida jiufengensis]KAI5952535.1 hypothetical protein KGF54_003402 [Candida jiufengensis]
MNEQVSDNEWKKFFTAQWIINLILSITFITIIIYKLIKTRDFKNIILYLIALSFYFATRFTASALAIVYLNKTGYDTRGYSLYATTYIFQVMGLGLIIICFSLLIKHFQERTEHDKVVEEKTNSAFHTRLRNSSSTNFVEKNSSDETDIENTPIQEALSKVEKSKIDRSGWLQFLIITTYTSISIILYITGPSLYASDPYDASESLTKVISIMYIISTVLMILFSIIYSLKCRDYRLSILLVGLASIILLIENIYLVIDAFQATDGSYKLLGSNAKMGIFTLLPQAFSTILLEIAFLWW